MLQGIAARDSSSSWSAHWLFNQRTTHPLRLPDGRPFRQIGEAASGDHTARFIRGACGQGLISTTIAVETTLAAGRQCRRLSTERSSTPAASKFAAMLDTAVSIRGSRTDAAYGDWGVPISGIRTGAAMPMNSVTLLLPKFAIQILPELSMAALKG